MTAAGSTDTAGAAAAGTYPFPPRCPFDLPEELDRLRRHEPVAPVRLADGATAWLVTGHDLVRTVLTDERFSRRAVRERALRERSAGTGAGGFDFGISITDPADNLRWRRLVGQALGVRRAERLRPRVRALVDGLLGRMVAAGGPAELMSALAFPLPLAVLRELFEMPPRLHPGFAAWAHALRRSGPSMAAFGESMRLLHETAAGLVEEECGRHGTGLLAELMSTDSAQADVLSEQEQVSTVVLLAIAGYETIAAQLGNGMLALFQHPEEWGRLRRGEVTADTAVEEILRYAQAGTGYAGLTHTACDVVLGGVTIPAGSMVFISIEAAARDETQVADPDRFDISRGAAGHHLAFGAGAHFCLGAALARVELQEALAGLLRHCPELRLVPPVGAVPITSNRLSRYPRELTVTW